MFYKTATKSSVIFSSDEANHKLAIDATVKRLGGAYEVDLVVMRVITTAEFYFEPHLPHSERACLVQEIFRIYEEELTALKSGKVQL